MNTYNHLMTDIETLDSSPTSVIVSIGAVLFNASQVHPTGFYAVVDVQDCIDKGLTVSGNTIGWWLKQSDEARKVFQEKTVSLDTALKGLRNHVFKLTGGTSVKVWGNSYSFDGVILENAYKVIGQQKWWNTFSGEGCYRTIKSIKGVPKIHRQGTHHNALDDAISQADHLIEINKHLGGIIL